MQPQESSLSTSSQDQPVFPGLGTLEQHLDLDLELCNVAGIISVGSGSELVKGTEADSNVVGGLEFASGVCTEAKVGPGCGTDVSPVDGEIPRRLSVQEAQTILDSRTSQRHSSDSGGK